MFPSFAVVTFSKMEWHPLKGPAGLMDKLNLIFTLTKSSENVAFANDEHEACIRRNVL